MRVIDVDAHFHEPLDWIDVTDPALAKDYGPLPRFKETASSVFGISNPKLKVLGENQQPTGGYETMTPGMVEHLEMTDALQPDAQESIGDNPHCGSEARLKFCDENRIDIQFLNPSFLTTTYIHAQRAGREDLVPRIRKCWNKWAMSTVEGHTDRLIPVTQIDLNDVPDAIQTMTEMRKAGSRAFSLRQAPIKSGKKGDIGKSLSHPDFDPVWAAAVDLGMAAIAHVGFGQERIAPGWANNGADNLNTFSILSNAIAPKFAPQLLISSLVLDGVFERHPKLTVIVEELGISWLPYLCDVLDTAAGRDPLGPMDDGRYRPVREKTTYNLPLSPTEYLQRNVWVTPLAASERLAPTIDVIPSDILCFSSDYPHVEGSDDSVAICEQQMQHLSQSARDSFFGGVGKMIGL